MQHAAIATVFLGPHFPLRHIGIDSMKALLHIIFIVIIVMMVLSRLIFVVFVVSVFVSVWKADLMSLECWFGFAE